MSHTENDFQLIDIKGVICFQRKFRGILLIVYGLFVVYFESYPLSFLESRITGELKPVVIWVTCSFFGQSHQPETFCIKMSLHVTKHLLL